MYVEVTTKKIQWRDKEGLQVRRRGWVGEIPDAVARRNHWGVHEVSPSTDPFFVAEEGLADVIERESNVPEPHEDTRDALQIMSEMEQAEAAAQDSPLAQRQPKQRQVSTEASKKTKKKRIQTRR